MAMSKSIIPPWTCSTRSSAPTTSAPASRASWAAGPAANTATRTALPVPEGSDTVPRTIWSALRGSTPRRTADSIVSSNLALAVVFTRSMASAGPYRRSLSRVRSASTYRLLVVMSADLDSHGAGGAGHLLLCSLHVVGVEVWHLGLGDLL